MNTGTILVPLDLAAGSSAALAFAARLAEKSDARLMLLHVVQLAIVGEERGIARVRLLNELCREAEAQLRQLAKRQHVEASVEVLVVAGRPAEVIVKQARRRAAEAVVMCTHGSHGWLKWLHRNTAESVLRQAPCPVWLVANRKSRGAVSLILVDSHPAGTSAASALCHES